MRISKKNILSQTTALMGFRISGCNIISPQQALELITRTYSHPTLEILLRHLQNKKKVSKQRKFQKYVFAKKKLANFKPMSKRDLTLPSCILHQNLFKHIFCAN